MAECDVCCGGGRYPVINRYGSELYSIRCPECSGIGSTYTDDEWTLKTYFERQVEKYNAAMAKKRERERP